MSDTYIQLRVESEVLSVFKDRTTSLCLASASLWHLPTRGRKGALCMGIVRNILLRKLGLHVAHIAPSSTINIETQQHIEQAAHGL